MSAQTTPHQSFPAPCKRCGGALYQYADVCPYCGASHPLGDRPHGPFVSPGAAASAAGAPRHPFGPETHADGATVDLPSPDTPIPPLGYVAPGPANGIRTLLTRGLIAIVVIMLGYAAYTLFGSHTSAPPDNEEDTQSTGGSVAPYVPGASPGTSLGASPGASPGTSAGTVSSGSTIASPGGSTNALPRPGATNQAANSAPPVPQAVVQPPSVPRYRDLSDSLRAARANRDANNLSGAQLAVNAAFSMQANSADAQAIQQELTPLERRRDAAIQTALVCVKDNLWNCVEHSARDALAVDTGSVEAKALLERAIVETGWAPMHKTAAPVARGAPAAQAAATEPPFPPLPPLPSPAPAAQPALAAPAAPAVSAAPAAPAAPAPNSVDAQERAIAQFGWKDSPAPSATPASGAAANH
jgi:hypothetical protein